MSGESSSKQTKKQAVVVRGLLMRLRLRWMLVSNVPWILSARSRRALHARTVVRVVRVMRTVTPQCWLGLLPVQPASLGIVREESHVVP